MIKILLLITIFVCCILIGIGIKNYYKRRKRFYSDLVFFCENCKIYISFAHTKLEEIVNRISCEVGQDFEKLLKNYLKYMTNQMDRQVFCDSKINFLTPKERNEIINFLLKLGEFDKQEELERIDANRLVFEAIKDKVVQDCNKFSSLYLKLFVILGLTFVIIFI